MSAPYPVNPPYAQAQGSYPPNNQQYQVPNQSYQTAPYPTDVNYQPATASSYGNDPTSRLYRQPMSKIELKVSCRNLIDLDVFSKSDPFVVVYIQTQNKEWREVGRSEVIKNNLNPDFVKSFIVDYYFEEQQKLKFDVYDSDEKYSHDLANQDYIGRLVTSLGSIVGENCGKIEQKLQTPTAKDNERVENYARKSPGSIIVRAEEVNSNRDIVTLHFSGKGLDNKDFFGKSDPFLIFERCNEDNSYSLVHKTEVIKNTLNPTWNSFEIPVQALCNGDYDRTIKVTCNDWDNDGSSDFIGSFEVVLRDLIVKNNDRPLLLINPKKAKKKSYKNSGTIQILKCTVYQKSTFLDYIRGGTALNFVVAVDFTASNGDPSTPQSLHFVGNPNQPSQYVQVLQAIGGIVEDYDSDKLFPAYGFGAELPPQFNVSHDFALNFNPQNPYCAGVNGIIAAYYNSVSNVKLYGPTNFSPIINATAKIAQDASAGSSSQYFVLLIITDGVISDIERTKEAIIHASSLPISIIIVGVGNARFDAMEELDGDDARLSHNGFYAERDIVQFVPFRDFMQGNFYNPASGERLAKNVLHELPDQVVGYMEKNDIKPGPPP